MSEGNPLALVVDDEVQIRRFLRAGLELDGLAVEEAENGGEALRWATLRSPDLVILDLGLPDMDGSEVLDACAAGRQFPSSRSRCALTRRRRCGSSTRAPTTTS